MMSPPFHPAKEYCQKILRGYCRCQHFSLQKETCQRMCVLCCCCQQFTQQTKNKLSKNIMWFFVIVANISLNKRNLSKDTVWFLSLLPTFHPTKETCRRILCGFCHCCQHFTQQKKPVEGYCVFFVIVANISPNKRNLLKDIVWFLSLLPTFHPTKETCRRILCGFCHCCQHFTQQKRPVEGYCVFFVIVANIPPNKRDLLKGIACFLLSCLKSQKQSKVADFFPPMLFALTLTNQPHFPSAS